MCTYMSAGFPASVVRISLVNATLKSVLIYAGEAMWPERNSCREIEKLMRGVVVRNRPLRHPVIASTASKCKEGIGARGILSKSVACARAGAGGRLNQPAPSAAWPYAAAPCVLGCDTVAVHLSCGWQTYDADHRRTPRLGYIGDDVQSIGMA